MPEVTEKVTYFTINVPVKISSFDLMDIGITAIEGGIGYWSKIQDYDFENKACLGTLIRLDDETEELPEDKNDWEIHSVTPALILTGIQRLLSGEVKVNALIIEALTQGVTGDLGCIDSEIADCVMQAACFNDLVYG